MAVILKQLFLLFRIVGLSSKFFPYGIEYYFFKISGKIALEFWWGLNWVINTLCRVEVSQLSEFMLLLEKGVLFLNLDTVQQTFGAPVVVSNFAIFSVRPFGVNHLFFLNFQHTERWKVISSFSYHYEHLSWNRNAVSW